ncbi:hypothetical protein [Streptomyces sp. NPDC090131]|uniref:hypothetical protein n=1 Tax=Streptomyces sp. NPDC090131 TaxID=3365954 RepID=UPI00381F5DD8
MTDAEFDPSGEQAVSSELAGVMPVEYVAFHSQNHVAYLKYAHLELGPAAAQTVVEDVFTFLLEVWPDALKEENLQAFAWPSCVSTSSATAPPKSCPPLWSTP